MPGAASAGGRKLLEGLRLKAREYVKSWAELLEEVRPSEEGFSERSVREDREDH